MAYEGVFIDESQYLNELTQAEAILAGIGDFTYNDANGYLAGRDSTLQKYMGMLNQGFQSSFKSDVDALYDKIMNYGDFSYDAEKDQLFQLYKQQYQAKGEKNMKNQLGTAAARSGGYNSSYAQSSAQQAYQESMNELNDKAVETYANAYQNWQNEYNNVLERYSLASQAQQAEENSYYNEMNSQLNAFNTFNSLYSDDRSNQYNQWSDELQTAQTNVNNAQNQLNWVKEYNATEKNNVDSLNQKAEQFDKQHEETVRHNNSMEKIAKKQAKGKPNSKKGK